MKKISHKIIIIILLIGVALFSEFFKRQVFAADYFIKQVSGKIILETTNYGKAWYVFPADNRRYYLGKPKDAFLLAKNLALEEPAIEIQKIKINSAFLNQNTKDSDQDGLSDALENWLGTDPNKKDSDQDGYPDNIEVANGYNPNSNNKNKIIINSQTAKKLAGNFIFNKNLIGLWYINPANLQAYYIENEINMLKLMQKVSLGMDSTSLQRIEGLIVGSQYMNEEIKKNETVSEPQTDSLRYTDNLNLYSFSFPQSWNIKKYPDAPGLIHITNADRDFISEKKASIMLQVINMGTSSSLENFKMKPTKDIAVSQETTKTIQGKQLYSKVANFPHMRKKSAVVDLLNGRFLEISLNTSVEVNSTYDSTFDAIINSLKFN